MATCQKAFVDGICVAGLGVRCKETCSPFGRIYELYALKDIRCNRRRAVGGLFVLFAVLLQSPVQGLSGYPQHFGGQALVAVGSLQGFLDQDIAGLFQ